MAELKERNSQKGFSLIEVLVAGLIITVGLVGMVLMQVETQQSVLRTHQLTLSGLYAQDLQERLRANVCYLNNEDKVDSLTTLNTFLNKQRNEWEAEHEFANRGWTSSWEGIIYNKSDIEKQRYWQFNLKITTATPKSTNTQSLLVDYKKGGC